SSARPGNSKHRLKITVTIESQEGDGIGFAKPVLNANGQAFQSSGQPGNTLNEFCPVALATIEFSGDTLRVVPCGTQNHCRQRNHSDLFTFIMLGIQGVDYSQSPTEYQGRTG